MIELVMFFCPEHGAVLETVPSAIVHHRVESRNGAPACGKACAPEGGRVRKSRKLQGLAAAVSGRARKRASDQGVAAERGDSMARMENAS